MDLELAPEVAALLRRLEAELAQLSHEDDFQRGVRVARILVIVRAWLETK